MTLKRLGKKLLKITGIFLGVVAVLIIAFHFWFINHAKGMLEDTVSEKTNGKIKLKIGKLRYNYFSQKMELDNAVFFTTDTLTAPSAYSFKVAQLRIQLNALLPLVLKKQLMIDSLFLQSPDIQVTILRHTTDTLIKKKESISIPYEMGKVYKSIQDGLKVLKVTRFQIQNGAFTLINKADPGQLPLTISQFNFHIDNLQVGTAKLSGKEKLLFSDNVVLTSRKQNIIFPDGRHRLSFSRFRINLKKKLVEFDSCTIEATKKDSTGSSFKVFFNALLLTNIDFDTLYRAEVIKADSVYCINPKFILDVGPGKNKGAKTQTPKLEKIIEQLTGDLQLGYVGVENADFKIKTIKDGKPSSFTFSKNNFEMEGLSVDQEAAKPIMVKNFAMAIRNYENFIKDSSYTIKFDSIIFKNNRLTLSNFLFNKLDNGKIINTFSVPRFSLEGLSWDYLVFEKKLKARLATMYQPHISYSSSAKQIRKNGRQNIFRSLSAVNEYMDLDQLDIENGNIDLTLNNNVRVQLDNATLSVKSHSLLSSTKMSGIKKSLSNLRFDKGRIHTGNLLLDLKDIRYTGGNGQFAASLITVTDKEKRLAASLQQVTVNKLIVDEGKGNIDVEGIKWQQGDLAMTVPAGNTVKANGANITIKGILGHNTRISSQVGNKMVSTDLLRISLTELKIKPGTKPVITGLTAEGKDMKVEDKGMILSVHEYAIADNNSSLFQQVNYKSSSTAMKADFSIPSMSMVPHIQSIVNGDISLDAVQLNQPVIQLHTFVIKDGGEEKKTGFPLVNIGEMMLTQPRIHFTRQTDSGTLSLHWQGNANNFLQVSGLKMSLKEGTDTHLDKLQLQLNNLQIITQKGKSFSTGEGKIAAAINDINFSQKEGDSPEWSAAIENLDADNFRLDSIGKSGGSFVLNSALLKDFHINSSSILKIQQLAADNPGFQLQHFTGHYFTANTRLHWYNAGFSRNTSMFTLDSFLFTPAMGVDSFLAARKFQTDYLKTSTGAVQIGPVDIDTYLRDSVLKIRTALIDNAFLFDHKDKTLPFNGGLIKPLPVELLKKIPFHLNIDTVMLTRAAVQYTEVNEKTKIAGTIPVKRMAVTLLNVKNHHPTNTDTLRIRANGYLLDTTWIRLRVNESYTDSLGSFVMTLRLKPGDITLLNKILIPMASVKLLSGQLDTLSMRAIGREYLALGEMKMFYRDLKIQLLKNGKDTKQPFFNRLASFAANTFLIKRNNSSRTGTVFFIRQRDKSAINYLIKIALSGMMSSVGIKKNKKMIRRYKHELDKKRLPPSELN